MKFAIISAGEGSRLSQEGVALPKPLVQLNGVAMIDRLIQIFVRNGADKVVVIINNESPLTKEHLAKLQAEAEIPLEVVVKTTPSSMHSFYELSPYLQDDKFCLTTVDTIFREEEFSTFIETFKQSETDGYMAVTDFIDDEKPLYISTDSALDITGFHDEATPECRYISGGIYCLTPAAVKTLHGCMEKGMSRMRNFQRQLVADGLKLKAYPFTKILDVDHAGDIVKAENFLAVKRSNLNTTEGIDVISIIGVSRGNEYSPNHVDNDAAIFYKVTEELRRLGCEVKVYAEKDFVEQGVKGDIIFDMARDKVTIARLRSLEDEGALVINSAYGIDNCVRKPMTELLIKNGVPHPQSFIISTADEYLENCYPCWVKRGDSHAMVKEDVAYATCKEEVENILADFRKRGIPVAVINEHLQGDLVKFYGVHGTDFFYWFYPSPCSHSKFGLEKINGIAKGIPFSVEELKIQSDKAAEALNVPIYGGDCVISADGTLRIIDFNDWPSFARCREEAGGKIAECIYKRAKKQMK